MKIFRNIILHLSAVAALVFAASCEDLAMGDNFLRKPPSNDVTIDTVFSTKEYAVRVLWRSYRQLPYGHCSGWNNWTGMWVGNLENLTDLSQSYVGYGGPESIYYSEFIIPELRTRTVQQALQNTGSVTELRGRAFVLLGCSMRMWIEYPIWMLLKKLVLRPRQRFL